MLERIKFMKVNKTKQFDYTPRYYDARKERIQNMRKAYDAEANATPTEQQLRLREKMQNAWSIESSYTKQSRSANIRLIIILAILLLATYFILDYVDIFTAEIIDLENP
ncbi:hypothetical protein DXU93_07190 [Brumimicrobium aurantiacum]|uniref:Uncharacterized protein n=1 Tax=Brumimicrobium aurantiacum TaxID=1737063 RepID=A0A3E1EZ51_9FLAO|nr:hypothetical protein DXU93_07190 [Brumimicrobium aurantiacum]